MKTREIAILLIGTLATFVFVGYMFDYYLRIEEVQLLRQNVYYDSLIIEQQKQLKEKDSVLNVLIHENDEKIRNHSYHNIIDFKKISKEIDSLNKK